jgi:hypothetical protein
VAISVQCRGCGKVHTVPDDWAGRSAKCNQCGAENEIPATGMTPVEPVDVELTPLDVVPARPVAAPPLPVLPVSATPEAQSLTGWESGRRTRHLIQLGFFLFLAFILPVAVTVGRDIHFDFLSLRGFARGDMPLLTRIELLYPLVAGVIVTVLGSAWEHRGRGVALLVLAALPFIAAVARPEHRESIRSAGSLLVLGTAMFLIAARTRFYRARWGVLYLVGLLAGGFFVAALLVPCKSVGALEGKSVYQFFTEDFFSGEFSAARGQVQALLIGGLIVLVLFGIAVLLALCNVPRKSGGAPAGIAGLIGAFVVSGTVLLAALVVVLQAIQARATAPEETAYALAISQIKMLVLYGGYLWVAIAGVVELAIGPARSY